MSGSESRRGSSGVLTEAAVRAHLERRWPDAAGITLEPLGGGAQEELKALGYGRPVRVRFFAGGRVQELVFRTMRADRFGHDRRADRVSALVLDFDSFPLVPRHAEALDVGVIGEDGQLVPLPRGEPFLVSRYEEGELYAKDLGEMEQLERARPGDLARARALALYLAELHGEPASALQYERSIRDTVGSGEGIFGIAESYPPEHPVVPRRRLVALEQAVIEWRWRLRERRHRARRIHGDFHPFNILFREGRDFRVLDTSRGSAGEPADDLTCLTINPLFFSLVARGEVRGALKEVFHTIWRTYLEATKDHELLEVVAPFFAWRVLVLGSPAWYPSVPDAVRERLFAFAERLLAGAAFDPERIEEVLP